MKVRGIGAGKFRLISNSIFVNKGKAGKIPDDLEVELKGLRKKVGSNATIANVLGFTGGRAKKINLRFLKVEVL